MFGKFLSSYASIHFSHALRDNASKAVAFDNDASEEVGFVGLGVTTSAC